MPKYPMPKFEVRPVEIDPKQEKVCADVSEARRKFAFSEAVRNRSFGEAVFIDDVIKDAIKIEKYLKGEAVVPQVFAEADLENRVANPDRVQVCQDTRRPCQGCEDARP